MKHALTSLTLLLASLLLAMACNAENGPQREAASTVQTADESTIPPTTEEAVNPDVSATVAAVLSRVDLSPPELSISDIVESLVDGLVQIITPNTEGSGFVVSNDGLIITSAHVVEEHEFVTVRSVDGWPYAGVVRGKNKNLDLAVVKIEPLGNMKAMPLGNLDKVRTGDPVIAMGFPLSDRLGEGYTITTGIVSSVRRGGPAELIQTDAAFNLGTSGGPLVNSDGKVIGVNTSTFREYAGVSFAVSIREVKNNLKVLAAWPNAGREFEEHRNVACEYTLRAPPEWKKTGEADGCRISLERYAEDDRVGAIHVWDYPIHAGEALEDFSAWWSDEMVERAGNWSSFTLIYSHKSPGAQQDEYVINYRWQESTDHCVSFATDRIVLSDQQRIALVFNSSVCDFMPPSVLNEIDVMEFYLWESAPVSE